MAHFNQTLLSLWCLRLKGKTLTFDYFLLFHFVHSHFLSFSKKAIFFLKKSPLFGFLIILKPVLWDPPSHPAPTSKASDLVSQWILSLLWCSHPHHLYTPIFTIVCSYWCWQSSPRIKPSKAIALGQKHWVCPHFCHQAASQRVGVGWAGKVGGLWGKVFDRESYKEPYHTFFQ